MRLDARVNVRELTLGEGLQPLSAVVDTKLNADLFLAAASMNGTLETHAVHLEGLPPGLMDMLGQGGKMLARFSLNPQRLVLHKAELRARTTAEASAEFDLEQNTFAGRLEATLPQIQTEAFDVTQGASLQASASGTPESFLVDLSAAAEKLSWQDMSLDSLTATVEARACPVARPPQCGPRPWPGRSRQAWTCGSSRFKTGCALPKRSCNFRTRPLISPEIWIWMRCFLSATPMFRARTLAPSDESLTWSLEGNFPCKPGSTPCRDCNGPPSKARENLY